MKRLLSTIAGAAVLTLALAACTAGGADRAGGSAGTEVRTLSYANPGDGNHNKVETIWADKVAELSDGTLKIEFQNDYAEGDTHREATIAKDVREGVIDLGPVRARAFSELGYNGFDPLLTPFVVDSLALQERVLADPMVAEMVKGLAEIGLTGLGALPIPIAHFVGNRRLAAPADFEGQRFGIVPSAMGEATLESLGAIVTVGAPNDGESMRGFDGVLATAEAVWGLPLVDEYTHVTANAPVWQGPTVPVARPELLESLTELQRDALTGAAAQVLSQSTQVLKDSQEDSMRGVCASGMVLDTVTEQELAALTTAVEPVSESVRTDARGALWSARLEELKGTAALPAPPLSCPPADDPAADAAGGIPNGTYTRTVTLEDIDRYDLDPALKKCFAGYPFELVFDDGSLTMLGIDGFGCVDTSPEHFTYTTLDGRIRISKGFAILADYTYADGELRFDNITFEGCSDCATNAGNGKPSGYAVSFGTVPTPWVRTD
ncbi:TRAP transporter substrate-binding protein [Microbacterium sp. B2969]|uniref:TRAP transporter substrate-binding protein n=1 Tax=Microbacterium alkaliflavum TaxID=3248839 RepID=A0ABW7QDI2_9MICO